jgi:hypothetical protein
MFLTEKNVKVTEHGLRLPASTIAWVRGIVLWVAKEEQLKWSVSIH